MCFKICISFEAVAHTPVLKVGRVVKNIDMKGKWVKGKVKDVKGKGAKGKVKDVKVREVETKNVPAKEAKDKGAKATGPKVKGREPKDAPPKDRAWDSSTIPSEEIEHEDLSPLDQFFAGYLEFEPYHDETKPVTEECYLMLGLYDTFWCYRKRVWSEDSDESEAPLSPTERAKETRARDAFRNVARQDFREALVLEFNHIYGTNANNLPSWQKLCQNLRIEPIPKTLGDCRKKVGSTYVNLVDLIDFHRTGIPVKVFKSAKELRRYTIKEEKLFPVAHAKAGGLLRGLLQIITSRG